MEPCWTDRARAWKAAIAKWCLWVSFTRPGSSVTAPVGVLDVLRRRPLRRQSRGADRSAIRLPWTVESPP